MNRGTKQKRQNFPNKKFLPLKLAALLGMFLILTDTCQSALIEFQGYMGTEWGWAGDSRGDFWFTVDGVSLAGTNSWACGNIIAGSSLRGSVTSLVDFIPNHPYTCKTKANDQICDTYVQFTPPFCYDLYVNNTFKTNGFLKTASTPDWRIGYLLPPIGNPNDPRYYTSQYQFPFYFQPNSNGIPLSIWNIKNACGADNGATPNKYVYKMPADGISKAYAAVQNTTFPATFIMTITNPGCTLTNVGNGAIFTPGTNIGTAEVTVITADTNSCLITNFLFECGKCSSGGCNCQNGAGVANDSFHLTFDLGPSRFGDSDAYMQVESGSPSPSLGSPSSLQCNFTRPDLVVLTNSLGWIRQIYGLDRVLDINTNTANSYVVSYYHSGDVVGYSYDNDLYILTNSPYKSVFVSLDTTNINHIQVLDSTAPAPADYYYESNGWLLVTGYGLRNESKMVYFQGNITTNVVTVSNSLGQIAYQKMEVLQGFGQGQVLLQSVIGSGPSALVTTNSYNSDGTLAQSLNSDGSWDIYTYDSMGRQIGHYSPFLNSSPTTNMALCRYTASTYTTNVVSGSGDDGSLNPYTPRMVVNYVLGNEVGRSYSVILPGERQDFQCAVPGASWNDFSNLVTTTYTFQDAQNLGKPSRIVNPDGTVQVFAYDTGVTCPMPEVSTTCDKTTVWTGAVAATNELGSVVDGTMDETWSDSFQHKVLHRITDVSSGIITDQQKYYYDSLNHVTNTVYMNRTSLQQAYDCCNLESSESPDGTVTSYGYDALKRRILTAQNGIIVSNILDADGNILGTIRFGTDGSVITNNLSSYDTAGRLISSTDGLGNTTTFTNYFDSTNQLIKVTTYPDLSTRIETYAMDGSLLSVTGTAVLPVRYAYGVELDGAVQRMYKKEIKLNTDGTDTTEWTKTYSDMLGRDYKTMYASASGSPSSQSLYNNNGQLITQVDPDGVAKLYAYNWKGQLAYTAVDMNTNGVIDFGGSDRITYTVSDVFSNGNLSLNRIQTYVWSTNGNSVSNLLSTAETSVDGLQSWNIVWNNGVGLTNYSRRVFISASGQAIITSVAPDGYSTVGTTQYGRLTSTATFDANGNQLDQITYGYDTHGRQNAMTDARNGTTTYFYNNNDQVTATLTPSPDGLQSGETATNILDNMGRIIRSILSDATSITNIYYTNGLLQTTYGSRTYPVACTYDYAGRMKTMTTWTNFATSSGAAVTTWNYDIYRGFLTNKSYANNVGPNYGYSAAGRLTSRTWVRGTTANYAYDNSGSIATVSYSDATPGITNSYDRLGREITVTNGALVCNWTYNSLGEPLTQSYSSGLLSGLTVTNAYDALLRRTTLSLLSSNGQILATTKYTYDAASRLSTVSDGANSAAYGYLANSVLIGNVNFQHNGLTVMTTTKQFDYLKRLTSIASVGGSNNANFNYSYNAANQRTVVTNADSSHWVYQYDNLGQVTSGKKYWADNTPVAGQQFTYSYDTIGNRQTASFDGDASGANLRTATYTINNLNQYTSRTVPGYVEDIGSANSNATVTVNLQRATRYSNYFADELAISNTSAPVYVSLTNLAVLNNGTNADIITTNTGSLLLPQTPENFAYDSDGNLTNSGRFTITWDAENRALSFASISTVPTAAKRKIDCLYDWQGRRIQKIISTNNGSAYIAVSTNRYVYDGWNLLAILDGGNNLLYSFQWGSDLSGSLQGAGGVGGLLEFSYHGSSTNNYFPAYDGNGNVTALINVADGTIAANYDYGPFGEVLRTTGPTAKLNPFRYSTKFMDNESDLIDYGYRYYDPSTGTWLNRDPIQERGGLGLYAFVSNDPLDQIDSLGLAISIDPSDPKHPGGRCSLSQTCRDNLRLLIALISAANLRLAADFTPAFLQLAKDKTPIPPDRIYNPNVTDYRTSWNNHVQELANTIARATECVTVISTQRKNGQCGNCKWLDEKRLRWRQQQVDGLRQKVPNQVNSLYWLTDAAAAFVGSAIKPVNPEPIGAAALLAVPGGEPEGAVLILRMSTP